jgi:cob(I)alamin adenosyltransferase
MNKPDKQRGLVLVYTGDGKGKTTAALGLAVRACGRGKRVLVIQFIKSPDRTYGEKIMFDKMGIEMHQKGIGFTWLKTPDEHREALKEAWAFTKEKVMSGVYDVVILDELNNALSISTFPMVITGRNVHPEVKNKADLVTEMNPLKHYYDEGIPAVKGIEF